MPFDKQQMHYFDEIKVQKSSQSPAQISSLYLFMVNNFLRSTLPAIAHLHWLLDLKTLEHFIVPLKELKHLSAVFRDISGAKRKKGEV